MSKCTDTVVTQVLCNLAVTDFLVLFWGGNLARLRQSFSSVFFFIGLSAKTLVCCQQDGCQLVGR